MHAFKLRVCTAFNKKVLYLKHESMTSVSKYEKTISNINLIKFGLNKLKTPIGGYSKLKSSNPI